MADNLSLERHGRITGSRIASVLGLSPHRSRSEVMREMVREHFWDESEFDGNFVTDFGQEHESDGIAEYEMIIGQIVKNKLDNQITVVDPKRPFAVTPDGWVGNDGLVEVKCPWRAVYTKWQERPDIEVQMRLQIETCGREWCDLAVWRTEGTPVSRLYRDVDWEGNKFKWLPSVMPEIEKFLAEYNEIIASEELSAPYRQERVGLRTDDEWVTAAADYLDLLSEYERLGGYLEGAKTNLRKLAGNETAKGAGIQVIYRRPSAGGRGSVSYKDALMTLRPTTTPVELDRFRGKSSPGGSSPTYAFKKIDEKES